MTFSSVHEKFTKIQYVPGHRGSPSKMRRTEIIQSMVSDTSHCWYGGEDSCLQEYDCNVQLNQGLIMEDIWKIITYLNIKIIVKCSLLVRKGSQEKLKLLELKIQHIKIIDMQSKQCSGGALIALNVYIRKEKRSVKNTYLNFYHKKLEEQITEGRK